jgi:hypothetical protein
MKTFPTLVMALLLLATAGAGAAQLTPDEREALRSRLERRFDILPLTDAIGLRPKQRIGDVRLIEIGDTISVNGETVTGRELRGLLGADADAVLRLTYLDADARRAFAATPPEARVEAPPETPAEPQIERPAEAPPQSPDTRVARRRSQDRIQIFGDIHVEEGETVTGQAVAVMGSVRIDGEVSDQVVAVMGSVRLGPKALVRGDIVSVGGRVHRSPGSQVRGQITEVALGSHLMPEIRGLPVGIGPGWVGFWDGFGAVPRLIGSTFRMLLLALIAAIALLVARPVVEGAAARVSDAPVHSTLVGMLAVVLVGPVLFMLAMLLVISIIGLPLLIAIPFVVFVLLLMAIAGFSGTAYATGQWAERRFGLGSGSPFLAVGFGVLLILLPLLVGRVLGLAGWWGGPVALLFVLFGLAVEFVAWSAGFGAVLANTFGRWQARRAARTA